MADTNRYRVNGEEFIIEDYNNSKAFASFLPAIAGLWGKPLWVYYVNRGQAIANFGIRDKDGAMMEFVAANKAWRQTASQGFRTFYKIDGAFYEPFSNQRAHKASQTMYIKPDSVRLVDRNEVSGIETEAVFCTLPGENFPALLRRLTIKNISSGPRQVECIDGMPMLLPWGTRNWMLKNLSRLAEGWFAGVHFSPNGTPYYKLPVEALDRPEIVPLDGAHFYCGFVKGNSFVKGASFTKGASAPLYCIDPDSVFGEQRDFAFPSVFLDHNGPFTVNPQLQGKNKTPSAMGYFAVSLPPGAEAVYYSMAGHCTNLANIDGAAALLSLDGFFENKEKNNQTIINGISSCVQTESAHTQFDTYCSQNFIDNALRGGFPVTIGNNTTYYAYSRVHGDMEREYNAFVVLCEYFSQGNGNYRDVNQNRRNDIFFNRNIGDDNIHFFMNLIQSDGFNPLKVLGSRFIFESEESKQRFVKYFLRNAGKGETSFIGKFSSLLAEPLTIGGLFNFIESNNIVINDKEALLDSLLTNAQKTGMAEHGEGYWSDHWTYNTDLIESYLAVFPDRFEELLLGRQDYIFYDDCYFVEPRSVKYVLFRGKPRQIRAVRRDPQKAALIEARKDRPNAVRADYGTGEVYYTTLLCKLLCLTAVKYASLDPDGLGMEMETDKPNWCDALNGLPGLFGSSSCETLELLRLVSFLNRGLAGLSPETSVSCAKEVYSLLQELVRITNKVKDDYEFWDQTHTAKEDFREITRLGLSGENKTCTIGALREMLQVFEQKLLSCREKLEALAVNGIVPTYFEYVPESFHIDDDAESKLTDAAKARMKSLSTASDPASGTAALAAIAEEKTQPVIIQSFKRKILPLFLEGPVHYLRLCPGREVSAQFHRNMLQSPLYDQKLGMIKVNAPLAAYGQDIGRITVFTPGWLEDESIWLHMEYKYLLELLRNGLAEEFFSTAKTALVPFFDPAVYGRSILENVSFIASSAHPEDAIHGQGFVARLSGATAEFISIWIGLTSGFSPFSVQNGELCLELKPCLPADYFTADNTFSFCFLGGCRVVYHNESRKNTFGPQAAAVQSYRIMHDDGMLTEITGPVIRGETAALIRDGKIKRIDIQLL